MVFIRFKNMDAAEYRGCGGRTGSLLKYVGNLSASLNKEAYKKNPALWGTLRKEGAPTALYLTSFQIVVSQSDARYTYRHAITNYTIPTIIIN